MELHKVMRFFTEPPAKTNATSIGHAQGMSDENLVEAAKLGQSTAFDALSERYRQQLFRAAHRITRSREDAEDAVQDSLLRAFVHMRDFDGRSKLGTWLTRIAITSALMILRKRRASPEIATDTNDNFDADVLHYEVTDHRANPEVSYAKSEEEGILKKAIQRLRPTLRVVIHIQLQERPMRETAEVIGISLAAAKGRLFHARATLRRSLKRKLVHQPRFANGFVFCIQRNGSRRANSRIDQQQSNHKEELKEHVIEAKQRRKYRAPSNLHPGGDGRDFSRDLNV